MVNYYTGKPHYFEQLALGNVPNKKSIYKFGRAENVGDTEQIVSVDGVYGLPLTADTVVVNSTDVGDVDVGLGAREIVIQGLDSNFDEIEETVLMGIATTQEFIRVFRAYVKRAGVVTPIGGGNIGTLTIAQSGGTEMVKIAPNKGKTLCSAYTTPKGYTALLWNADATASSGKNVDFKIMTRELNGETPFTVEGERDAFENTVDQKFKIPSPIREMTDIVFVAKSSASGANLSATFLIELIKNT